MSSHPADLADGIADLLADPSGTWRRSPQPPWWRQALAGGALGITLLHVERARTGNGPWSRAHAWLRAATAGPIDDGPDSHLHYGAPALGFVLHHAATALPGTYRRALTTLDTRIQLATRARLDAAHRRIDQDRPPALAEFDAIRGLTGLGAYWLTRDPGHPLVRDIATYLVRLTQPRRHSRANAELPGWWTDLGPSGRRSPQFPRGHINNGLAHGIAGPLALLALAATAGIRVPGDATALRTISAWLDTCHRQDTRHGTWWSYWTTPHPDATSRGHPGLGRPSWCYGATGVARAYQLAGIALRDPRLRHVGEDALRDVVDRPHRRDTLTGASICHGLPGLLHITRRARTTPRIETAIDDLRERATAATSQELQHADPPLGLLDGLAGAALALTDDVPDEPGWDRCLLIN